MNVTIEAIRAIMEKAGVPGALPMPRHLQPQREPMLIEPSQVAEIKRSPGFAKASTVEVLETGEIGTFLGRRVFVKHGDLLQGARIRGLRYG